MEIVRLTKADYDEWLDVLNTVFTRQNNREMDFEKELPKMCVRDDYHMNKHIAVKEDGKICALLGVYPIRLKAGDTELLFSTVGNVATLPEYEGRGYMRILMEEAMRELQRIGADASRLCGARQRYNRYGYEAGAISYEFQVDGFTTKYCHKGDKHIEFKEIFATDAEELTYIKNLRNKMPVQVVHSGDDNLDSEYKTLVAFGNKAYVALDEDGERVGYISVSDNMTDISDIGAEDFETLKEIIFTLQKKVGDTICFSLPPYIAEAVNYFCKVSAEMSVISPSRFKIINFDKVADAFIKIKKQSGVFMPVGESVIEIKEWGKLLICNTDDEAYCKKTDKDASMVLDRLEATRFLFGPFEPNTVLASDAFLSALLPLPLSWCDLDRV